MKNFKTYVKREIVHQSSLKHPFIVSLKEVSFAILNQQLADFCRTWRTLPALQSTGCGSMLRKTLHSDVGLPKSEMPCAPGAAAGVSYADASGHCHGVCSGR